MGPTGRFEQSGRLTRSHTSSSWLFTEGGGGEEGAAELAAIVEVGQFKCANMESQGTTTDQVWLQSFQLENGWDFTK